MADNNEYMLTTIDNPFNPHTHFDEWFAFDVRMGYNTSSYLARMVRSSHELSEADQEIAYKNAVDEIVKENVLGIYKKIFKTEEDVKVGGRGS